MRKLLMAGLLLLALTTEAPAGKFDGELVLEPTGCERQLECTLKFDFGFIDAKGLGWQAKAGLKTDGASIPWWAQPFVGGQFEKEFVKAAVIHDHYCIRHVRTWQETHNVLYEALVVGGVSEAKAGLMYYAVYSRGPKWADLIRGEPCPVGRSCIQRVGNQAWSGDLRESRNEENKTFVYRKAQYDDPNFARELRETEQFIASRNGRVTLQELEARAKALRPTDEFFLGTAFVIQP